MPSKYGIESLQEERTKQREFNAKKTQEEAANKAAGKAASKASEEKYKRWRQEKVQKAKDTIRQNSSVIQDVVNDVSEARGLRPWDIRVKEKDGDIVVAYDGRWRKKVEKQRVARAIANLLTKQFSINVSAYDVDPRDRHDQERYGESSIDQHSGMGR